MSKQHNENDDLRAIGKIANINRGSKTISLKSDNINVGLAMQGKIDFLTKYCGYTFIQPKHSNNSTKEYKAVKGNIKDIPLTEEY